MEDNIIKKDIDYLIDNLGILSDFSNSSFFITGATGLIGSQLVKLLLEFNKKRGAGIHVYILCRNIAKAEKIFAQYMKSGYLHIIEGDIINTIECDANIDYIIHGASITQSRDFVKYPVETIKTCVYGTENVLSFATRRKIKRIIYLSSLEVYGQLHLDRKVKENDCGYIDFTLPRSSYSEGKRIAENLCFSYSHEYNIDVLVARLTQTFGPGVDYNDNRVFAQFTKRY